MSSAYVHVFLTDGSRERSVELRNSHRLIPIVWDDLCKRYLSGNRYSREGDVARFWEERIDRTLPEDDRFLLYMTYDQVLLPHAEFERAIALTARYGEVHPAGCNHEAWVSHWPAVAELLRELKDREDVLGVGFRGTSVSEDPWWEPPAIGDDGEPLDHNDLGRPVDPRTAPRVVYGAESLVSP